MGEVAILAGKPYTSVTIETTTDCTVLYFSRKDFEDWIEKDIHFLRLVSQKVAYSCTAPPTTGATGCSTAPAPAPSLLSPVHRGVSSCVIRRTREEIHEETGISVKTLNRTIRKLKESGMVGITKGKVTMDEAQQKMAREYVQEGRE